MHAYILSGGSVEALYARAVEMAAEAVCLGAAPARPCHVCRACRKVFGGIHPDVITVERPTDDKGKLKREIGVDRVRQLTADAAVFPNEAARKVYILREADTMNMAAQNAFLKLLEEPPSFVVFLLCAENPGLLLETVRSRCATVRVGAGETSLPPEAQAQAKELLACRNDRAKLLRCCTSLEKLDAAEARDLIEAARRLAVDAVPDHMELRAVEKLLTTAAEYLRQNVSVKHVMGFLATYP